MLTRTCIVVCVGAAINSFLDARLNGSDINSIVLSPDGNGGATILTDTPEDAAILEHASNGKVQPKVICEYCKENPCVMEVHYDHLMEVGEFEESLQRKNKEVRFKLYREATRLLHGYLGRQVRKELPGCVVRDIHDAYPEPNSGEYVGFSETNVPTGSP